LGLAIAKQIAEAHHGELTAASEEGSGSTFVLTLPKSQPV
jgi:signal transduction histidine kinase